ncbi:MAG TPA: response regulator [Verrucomicrobiae bacterium]|jgi:PAS domain S-box-containing protein|nr:response regulator [Verrucomicrobiae bacterium]
MQSIDTEMIVVPKPELDPVNILLVDDESRNLDALESVLESVKGLRLFRALRAEEALLALLNNEFACLVLDIQMPGMSGLELARDIKARKRNQNIPIIFLTAFYLDEKDIITGYGVGAVDYLTKPINPDILKSKVGAFADLFRTARALAAANAALELEVVQRKNAEEALRRLNNSLEASVRERTSELRVSQERYEQVVRNLPLAVYTTDADGRITLYNEAAAELWGRHPKIGQEIWCDAFKIYRTDGSELPADDSPMALTLKTGEPVSGQEIVVERPDGARRNVLPYPTPIRDSMGKISGVVNMLLDVTDRNLALLMTQRFAAIVESSDDAIVGKDTDGIINGWNHGAERIFQYKPGEIIGKSVTVLIPPERHPEEMEILKRVRNGEQVRHFETIRRRKDGHLIDVSLTISPVKDASGKVVGASKIARDITERKRNERQQHALYALVARVNSAPSLSEICDAALETIFQCQDADRAALLLIDSQGTMMRFKAWRGLSDEYRRAVEGHSPWKPGDLPQPLTVEDTVRAGLGDELRGVIEKEGIRSLAFIPITYEKRLLGKLMLYFNAPHVFAEDELKPAQTIASQIAFAIEREFVSQQLKRANDELLAASRAKDDFMATLSHELRTPLNPVLLLASDAMNNRDLPPRVRADFNTIRKNIEMEARLIDDLLDLTRIARGKIILEKHFVNLRTVLTDAVAQVREEMNQKKLRLELRLKAEQHTVYADAVRLQQIFWNLLKNAVKFTPEGGLVTVETELAGTRLLTKISDTGIGMTDEELAGIFKAFAQGEHATANGHRFGGLGLGLSISQKLTELHSGRIVAASGGRDRGSAFTVELPLVTAAEANGKTKTSSALEETHGGRVARGIRILLVEDHEPTRTTLASLLARRNYDVVAAATVQEARTLAKERNFDLLITDIGLPDGNGYDLMNELGKENPLRGIALTGYGMEHDVARSENAGFDAHLTKPVRIQSLEAALDATSKLIEKT